jgi:aspartyl protease family protein
MDRRRLAWLVLVAFAVAAGGATLFLAFGDPGALASRDDRIHLVQSGIVLVLLVAALVVRRRAAPGHLVRHLAVWIAIGSGLVLAYGARHDLSALGGRFLSEAMPARGRLVDGAVTVRESRGGHFQVEAEVDGTPVRFLVDTGATDVTLSPADARRLGFDLARLRFDRSYRTANGTVTGAPVRLRTVAIGPIRIEDVRASVNGAAMERSLLGMSFLSRLSGYEVRDGVLFLRP